MTSREDYVAAKERVERFMRGEFVWYVWGSDYPDTDARLKALRADLNLIAEYEGQVDDPQQDFGERVQQIRKARQKQPVYGDPMLAEARPTPPAISRRDYMVGQALGGLLANGEHVPGDSPNRKILCQIAVKIADAALKEMGE